MKWFARADLLTDVYRGIIIEYMPETKRHRGGSKAADPTPADARCRGCGESVLSDDTRERAVTIEIGKLDAKSDDLRFTAAAKDPLWGRMHEKCFLLAIGDRRGVVLAARHA